MIFFTTGHESFSRSSGCFSSGRPGDAPDVSSSSFTIIHGEQLRAFLLVSFSVLENLAENRRHGGRYEEMTETIVALKTFNINNSQPFHTFSRPRESDLQTKHHAITKHEHRDISTHFRVVRSPRPSKQLQYCFSLNLNPWKRFNSENRRTVRTAVSAKLICLLPPLKSVFFIYFLTLNISHVSTHLWLTGDSTDAY